MRVSYRRAEGRVSVAPLASGGFAVAWTLPGRGLALRRFAAEGTPLGPEVLVAPGADPDGAIHALPEGGFVAIWTSPDPAGKQRVLARRYSFSGTPQGAAVTIETFASGTFRGVNIGPGPSLLVTRQAAATSVCGTIGRRYALDGRPLAKASSICSAHSDAGSSPPAVAAGAGSLLTAWEGFGGIYMRRLGLNGTPLGPTWRVDQRVDDNVTNAAPVVAQSPAGASVVLWKMRPCIWGCSELQLGFVTVWSLYLPAGERRSGPGGGYLYFCQPGEDDHELVSGPDELFAAVSLETCYSGGGDPTYDLQVSIFSATPSPPSPPPPPPPLYPGGHLSFSQSIYSVREEQRALTVTVKRTGGTGCVSASYKASGGSARPGVDYVPVSGRLIWRDGDFADKIFTVPILADGVTDKPADFFLSLSLPAGGVSASSSVPVYIDSPGFLGFGWEQPVVLESAGSVNLRVQRLGGSRGAVSVRCFAGPPPGSDADLGAATEGEDYLPEAGTLRWQDGDEAPKTVSVPILDDDEAEGWEMFIYSLADPTGGAALRRGLPDWIWTVIEDDEISLASPGRVRLAADAPLTVEEGEGSAVISVRRTGGMAGKVSVRYTASAGTAKPGADFTPVSGVLVWGDSDLSEHSFAIPIRGDQDREGNETVKIELSAPTGGAVLGIPSAAVLTILDDDH
jgi:hypothetical protein